MTGRARRPTDRLGPPPGSSREGDVTEIASRPTLRAMEDAAPTRVDLPRSGEHATPTEVTARAERSEPIRVISMKDASGPSKPRTDERRAVKVQLRSIAEARRHDTPPVGLGHLAPPRDPKKARNRRLIDNIIWGCVAIMLACAIMLAIWLVAGR